jgi:hypothetical protein
MKYAKLAEQMRTSYEEFLGVRKALRSLILRGEFLRGTELRKFNEWDCSFIRKMKCYPSDITIARLGRVFEYLDAMDKGLPYTKSSRSWDGGSMYR